MSQRKFLTEEEVKSMIDLQTANKAGEVAEAVFEKKTEDMRKKVDSFSGKIDNLVLGVIIGGAFLFVSLIVSVIIFMASMKSSYFQTQDTVNNKVNELVQNNSELEKDLRREIDKIQDKQEYIERTLIK